MYVEQGEKGISKSICVCLPYLIRKGSSQYQVQNVAGAQACAFLMWNQLITAQLAKVNVIIL